MKINHFFRILCACFLSVITYTHAHAQQPLPNAPFYGEIEQQIHIPGTALNALKVQGKDSPMFISANGRYAFIGTMIDVWDGGKELTNMVDILSSTQKLPLEKLGYKTTDLAPLIYGEGSKEVSLFIDPLSEASILALLAVKELFKEYRFSIMAIPAYGKKSGEPTRAVSCAIDQQAAFSALINKSWNTLIQNENCDLVPIQRRIVVAQIIGLRSVPFFIAPNGDYQAGLPDDLKKWLEKRS